LEQVETRGNGRRTGEAVLSATVDALAYTLGLRDRSCGAHSSLVADVSYQLGRALRLRPRAMRELRYAAELHDIGKVGIPDHVLLKPGPLDTAEWKLIEGHSAEGAELIARIPGLERVASIVRHHHERVDGGGYPDRLCGTDIPLESRILSVADAYVAMIEDRPYRRGLSPEAAKQELRENSGDQFDPEVVDTLFCLNGALPTHAAA
jgi:HD-GYP domain-containing protein (c-di-GMP phosphodiesterase class II)